MQRHSNASDWSASFESRKVRFHRRVSLVWPSSPPHSIVTAIVPPLLMTHALIFVVLIGIR